MLALESLFSTDKVTHPFGRLELLVRIFVLAARTPIAPARGADPRRLTLSLRRRPQFPTRKPFHFGIGVAFLKTTQRR
jgi:hypothetical protein